MAKSTQQIFEHREKQQRYYEEQKMREERLSMRDQNDLFRSTYLLDEYQQKDAKSKQLIEKQRIKRRIINDNWRQKFEKTRENALIVTVEDTTEACNGYAEKMIKIQKDTVRNEGNRKSNNMWNRKKEKKID